MITLNGKTYSGQVAKNEGKELVIVLYSTDSFQDIAESMCSVKTITENVGGTETIYNVTEPMSCKLVSSNVYSVSFSTAKSFSDEILEKIEEQNELIDSLIIAMTMGDSDDV